MKKLSVSIDMKSVDEVKALIDSANALIHEVSTYYYKDNLGRDLASNAKFIDLVAKTPGGIKMTFTEWYRRETGGDWHDDYAWIESEKVYDYEEYCNRNGIEPVYDG